MSGRGRGRGEYFKNKYGRGGRGRGAQSSSHDAPAFTNPAVDAHALSNGSRDWRRLQNDLVQMDGAQYGVYKRLLGTYSHASGPTFTLSVDRVQQDPYASPSKCRTIMSWNETGLPDDYLHSSIRKTALCDFVTRVAADIIRAKHLDRNIGEANGGWSGPKGGSFNINAPGQEVLPRTSAMINGTDTIELRFTTTLPAAGRTILGQQAFQILGVNLVELVRQSLLYANLDQDLLRQHVLSVERQYALRHQLHDLDLIAFIANGSILPRASGAAAAPMDSPKAVLFQSPEEAEVILTCPDGRKVSGMGISRGITLLTGGGFHGKSTILEALELGIYDHVPGDGRELVVTDPTAVKIRAEDGRSVCKLDISPFISNLPGGKETTQFSTDDASGSTSMASNIQEALEAGSQTLLIDEDSSATNLLVRDQRMQSLIKKEPITPLISKARALYRDLGVSTVIVIGGLGDWLSVSDTVIVMDSYIPRIITIEAKSVVAKYPSTIVEDANYGSVPNRSFRVNFDGFRSPYAQRKGFITTKMQARNPVDDPAEAEPGIDLTGLDQIVEVGQSRTIAALLENIANETKSRALSLREILQVLDDAVGTDYCLPMTLGGEMVAVRRFELAAALSRYRGLIVGD